MTSQGSGLIMGLGKETRILSAHIQKRDHMGTKQVGGHLQARKGVHTKKQIFFGLGLPSFQNYEKQMSVV